MGEAKSLGHRDPHSSISACVYTAPSRGGFVGLVISPLSLRLRRPGSVQIAATSQAIRVEGHRCGEQSDFAHKFVTSRINSSLQFCIPAEFQGIRSGL